MRRYLKQAKLFYYAGHGRYGDRVTNLGERDNGTEARIWAIDDRIVAVTTAKDKTKITQQEKVTLTPYEFVFLDACETGIPVASGKWAIRYRFIRGNSGGFLGWNGSEWPGLSHKIYTRAFWENFTDNTPPRHTLQVASLLALMTVEEEGGDITWLPPRTYINPRYKLPTKR